MDTPRQPHENQVELFCKLMKKKKVNWVKTDLSTTKPNPKTTTPPPPNIINAGWYTVSFIFLFL